MIRSILIASVAGLRALTPLAVVSAAARSGAVRSDQPVLALLGNPAVRAGITALAAGELFGDKLQSSPDRIILPGLLARLVTGSVVAAALAPRRQRRTAALLGAAAAVGAAYLSFDARMTAMRRFGQVPTGLVEDALAMAAATWIVGDSWPRAAGMTALRQAPP